MDSPEALLIRSLRDGDEAAFDSLVDTLQEPMLRLARTIAGVDGAEEVVQDTWAAVIDGLERFEGRSSLKTWIYRILTNRARTWAVRAKRSVPTAFEEGAVIESEAAVSPDRFSVRGRWTQPLERWDVDSPEALLLRAESRKELARELENLPPAQRAVVILRDVEGCSSEEVCEILSVTEVNQRVLLHRGRSKLRAAMERRWTGGGNP